MAICALVVTKYPVSTPYNNSSFRLGEGVFKGMRRFNAHEIAKELCMAVEDVVTNTTVLTTDLDTLYTFRRGEWNPCDIEYMFLKMREAFLESGDTSELRLPSRDMFSQAELEYITACAAMYRVQLRFMKEDEWVTVGVYGNPW
mgnify:CR=1 FL=1